MNNDLNRGARLRALNLRFAIAAVAALGLSACGGGSSSASPASTPAPPPAPTFAVAGTLSASSAAGLVLNNGSQTLAVPAGSTTFSFPGTFADGTTYDVAIGAEPTARDQSCAIAAGSGTIAGADANVAVNCHAIVWSATEIAGATTYTAPYVDGPVATATFAHVQGMTFDAAGNLYVADQMADVIRKITPDGIVSTFAGSGQFGHTDGPAESAAFLSPHGLAFDASGNLFVADNTSIRKVAPDGTVSTLAGSPLFPTAQNSDAHGFADGVGSAALFNAAYDVKVDASGNVFVTDNQNYAIRKITPDGTVTTIAGTGAQGFADGTGTAAAFQYPSGLAIDASGNLFVADEAAVRKITPAGVVTTLAGGLEANSDCDFSNQTGPIVASTGFCQAIGIAIDAEGNLFVADSLGNAVRKLAADGTIVAVWGTLQSQPSPTMVLVAPDDSVYFSVNAPQSGLFHLTPN